MSREVHSRRLGEQGFTLMEVLAVLSVMTILMGLSAYALTSYFRAQALTSAAGQLLTDLRDTQVRAQAEVRPYRILFDPDADTYRIERLVEPRDDCPDPCYDEVETRVIDSKVNLASVSFAPTGSCGESDLNFLTFCPRGVSSDGSVLLVSRGLNQDREITVIGLTSRAEVR